MDDAINIKTAHKSTYLTVTKLEASDGFDPELWLDASGPHDSIEIQLTNKGRKQLRKALKRK